MQRLDITRDLQFGNRQLPVGAARVADHDGQFVFIGAVLRERVVVDDLGRLVVFVGAQHAHVEVVAREIEIVGIAAEERHRQFRREYQAHILVTVVLVYIVDAAVIQIDHVAARVVSVLAHAFGFDIRFHRLLGLAVLLAALAGRGLFHTFGDIGDGVEPVELDLGTLDFVFFFPGIETRPDEILVGCRKLLHAGVDAVVIGQHETGRRNERARTATGQTQRGVLGVLGPLRIR